MSRDKNMALIKVGKNEEGEQEFIGTDRDWEEYDKMVELEIDDIKEERHMREEAFIQYNEDTKEQFNLLTIGDFKEIDNGN